MKRFVWDYPLKLNEKEKMISGFTITEVNGKYNIDSVESYGFCNAEDYKKNTEYFLYFLNSVIENKDIDTWAYPDTCSYGAIQELIDLIKEQEAA